MYGNPVNYKLEWSEIMPSEFSREVPKSLQKKGITGIKDNLKLGETPDWVKLFIFFFRPRVGG